VKRTGRRPGDSGAREAILDAARGSFAERGYERTTIRGVAASAGVDPALVHHYFGAKADLFQAAARLPVDPAAILALLSDGDASSLGERVTRMFVTALEVEASRDAFLALLRAAVSNPDAAGALRSLVTRQILGPVVSALGRPDADLRTTLVATHLVGLAMGRHVLRIEPLVRATPDRLVSVLAPTIQRYLTGDLAA